MIRLLSLSVSCILKHSSRCLNQQHKLTMDVYTIDPTKDERWDALLQKHTEASVFHTGGWLEALRQTYGYKPVAFTTSPPGNPLTNALPLCQISSLVNGKRLVSLPFSDHCEPLVDNSEELAGLLTYLQGKVDREKWSYIEIRPSNPRLPALPGFRESGTFFFHKLDLRPSLDAIFHAFHKDCVQRKIQRAATRRSYLPRRKIRAVGN